MGRSQLRARAALDSLALTVQSRLLCRTTMGRPPAWMQSSHISSLAASALEKSCSISILADGGAAGAARLC